MTQLIDKFTGIDPGAIIIIFLFLFVIAGLFIARIIELRYTHKLYMQQLEIHILEKEIELEKLK